MKYFWTILTVGLVLLMSGCGATVETVSKINGVSYVASNDSIAHKNIVPLLALNANYAAVMPFGFIQNLAHPEVVYNTERQWFGETEAGITQYVTVLQSEDIQIMLKPQLWVWRGEFTGFIEMENEENWQVLEKSYAAFILEYAKLADKLGIEILCIGTELERFIEARPSYWKALILQIKKVYHGKLTYAANWNEYLKTPFWDDLDYIGIDAYFPVDSQQTATKEASKMAWQKYKNEMLDFAVKYNRQILFTEYGYRSIDYAGRAPWTVDKIDKQVNLEAQKVLTEVLFEQFWNEKWFAGGFVWKWFHQHENAGGLNDNRFSPQNKPAESVIKTYYKKFGI